MLVIAHLKRWEEEVFMNGRIFFLTIDIAQPVFLTHKTLKEHKKHTFCLILFSLQ